MNKNKNKNVNNALQYPFLLIISFFLTACEKSAEPEQASDMLSFNESIRPILNKHCVGCHGGVTKQGGISYIYRDQAITRGNSGRLNIVPHNAKASEFIQRIKSKDPSRRMPYKRPALSEHDIALLERWVNEGAQWQEHWAFIPPQAIEPPKVDDSSWLKSPIDAFVLTNMQNHHLAPNQAAAPEEWLRRVSLDLVGLPPTENDIIAFLNDPSEAAYEQAVDNLLADPAFGERWASVWLDLARYSDSRGFERDKHRDAWPYRDWLVNAYNQNMPYNHFVTKQLAGDLLPDATLSDHIATTFHRLTPANDEAGTDDEEYRTYAVMDRSATTWRALNGITMNCVQCHAHPYDPITHEEYFSSLAYFNTSQDADRRDDGPNLKVAQNKSEQAALFHWQKQVQTHKQALISGLASWHQQADWKKLVIEQAYIDEQLAKKALAEVKWLSLTELEREKTQACFQQINAIPTSKNNQTLGNDFCEQEYLKTENIYYKDYLTATANQTATEFTSLKIVQGELSEPKLALPAMASYQIVTAEHQGQAQQLSALKLTSAPLAVAEATHSPKDGFTIERINAEVIRNNGESEPLTFKYFAPSSTYGADRMFELQAKRQQKNIQLSPDWLTGFTSHLQVHPVTTTGILTMPVTLYPGDRIKVALAQLQRDHSRGEKPYYFRQLKLAYASRLPDVEFEQLITKSINLTAQAAQIKAANLPVMREQIASEQRSTRLFHRGNFADKKGDDIAPSPPVVFPKSNVISENHRATRLDLANWFFNDQQPLTARVAVNRFWAELFGQGIVTTLGDFGSIGATPSNPALLDWLANYFKQDLNWNVKALLKSMVLSASYRQSAQASADKIAQDPHNTYLARGPYQRLSAEMVRDQALLAAGLLSNKQGGPSVMPPQPPGVWNTVYNKHKWVDATGEDRFRRALYTYNKRTSPYPSYILFDDTGHIVSAEQRFVTNTPLQALVTLNDVVYHEAAQSLGEILYQTANQQDFSAAVKRGYLRVLSRYPSAAEQQILLATFNKTLDENPDEERVNAWTLIASILLNLDASLKR